MLKIILGILLFGSCSKEETPKHIDLSAKIRKTFTQEIAKEYSLEPMGYGGGYIDTINKVYIAFTTQRTINLDQARIEYVNIISELLKAYNHNKEVRPYLQNYPFTPSNVEIFIIYNDDDKVNIPDRVYTVNMSEGVISFRINNEPSAAHENYVRETFEEAYFKVYSKEWTP